MKSFLYIASLAVLLLTSCEKAGEDVVAEITTCELYSDISTPGMWDFHTHQFPDRNIPEWVQFTSNQVAFIAGSTVGNGQAYAKRSMDGGVSWSVFPMGFHEQGTAYWFQDEGYAYVGLPPNTNQNTRLALTVDGGVNWYFSEYDNLEGQIVDFYFENDEEGYALLESNEPDHQMTLLRTIDAAQSWVPVFTDPTLQRDLTKLRHVVTDQFIYLTGAGGNIYKFAKSSQELLVRQGPETEIRQLCVVDEDVLFAIGLSGMFVSNDGAMTWTRKASGDVRIGAFFNATHGMIVQNHNYCPSNVYHAHDAISATNNQGDDWIDGDLTSNLLADFASSQLIDSTHAVMLIGDRLVFCDR